MAEYCGDEVKREEVAAALERRTALFVQVQLGEYENAKRLLQAGADPNAATAGTPPPLGLQPARAPVCACWQTCVPRAC